MYVQVLACAAVFFLCRHHTCEQKALACEKVGTTEVKRTLSWIEKEGGGGRRTRRKTMRERKNELLVLTRVIE